VSALVALVAVWAVLALTTGALLPSPAVRARKECVGYFPHPRHSRPGDRSGDAAIVMVQTAQDGESDDASRVYLVSSGKR